MIMVDADEMVAEQMLTAGKLCCPDCAGFLRPWGHARERVIRMLRELTRRIRPRRSRCRGCGRTHVLLPCWMLLRRADSVEVIGEALQMKADRGCGFRLIAEDLDVPDSTVRGWFRRFTTRAEHWRTVFTKLVASLDPQLGAIQARDSVFADAVEVIALAATAAAVRFGPRPPWQVAAKVSQGVLLAPAAGPG